MKLGGGGWGARASLRMLLLLASAAAFGQPREYDVKAAFLLNFTRFIEWPASAFADATTPFRICILGRDPFGHTLDEIVEGEAVNRHRLEVRRLTEIPAIQTCQIVFFGTAEKELLPSVGGPGRGILTVGDGENFVRAGGMIAFVIDHQRVRFDINLTVAEGAGLKLSSKLLNVARSVHKIGMGPH